MEIAQQLEGDDMDIENAEDHYLHYAFILLFFLMNAKKVHKINWLPSKLETIQSCFLYTHVSDWNPLLFSAKLELDWLDYLF